ncbi:TLC ATP/ADP transporter-domain-containing protein [Pavlovales sp. CCMP2436]|nr:TLC ATP/ADP transporter-domain-containing protein [Pavlovales sp. CCMP2436]
MARVLAAALLASSALAFNGNVGVSVRGSGLRRSAASLQPQPRALGPLPSAGLRSHVHASSAIVGDGAAESEPKKRWLPPANELKKVLPLGLMFFFILFNYTILRDTKARAPKQLFAQRSLVTAPKCGAEIIPFLKTYVNLPGAVLFTVAYSKLTNK